MGIFSKWFGGGEQAPSTANDSVSARDKLDDKQHSNHDADTEQDNAKQRLQRLKNSTDIPALLQVYQQDSDDLMVECADMRLREWLLSHEEIEAHAALTDAKLSLKTRKTLAAKAKSEALRHAMLAQLDDDQSLSEVIAYSDDWQIKAAAMTRLNDTDTLKTLIKQYKGKQKVAYRAAKNRLAVLKTQQQTVDDLHNRLANLITAAEAHTLSSSAVSQFEQQLQAQQAQLSAKQQHMLTSPLADLHAAAAATDSAKQARQHILSAVESIHRQLENQDFNDSRKAFHAQLNQLQHDWANLPVWGAAESKALNIRFEQLLSQTNTAATRYFDEKHQQSAQQKLLSQCQRWLEKNTFVSADKLSELDKRWAALPLPPAEPNRQFNELMAQLREKTQQHRQAQHANDAAVPELLQQLQAALDDGETQQAQQLHQDIREHLDSEAKLSKPVYQQISAPLKQLENRLHELKRWQHFGDDQARQALIEAMQALIDNQALATDVKATQIQALQQQWKSLKGRAPNAQWQQFKTLGDTAWQPVAEQLRQQRQASKSDLQKRLAFLTEVEQQLHRIDWQQPDWATINAAHRRFEQQWRNFPKLQEHDYRQAKKAYRPVAELWQQHLGAERKRELQRRERLITLAQAQQENDDTHAAIETIKQLQQQWAPSVGLKRREHEQALWQRFKTACDAVFARHGEHRAQAQEIENAAFRQYKLRIQALEDLLQNTEQSFEQSTIEFHRQLADLQANDNATADSPDTAKPHDFVGVSGKAASALRQQLTEVVQRFEAKEQAVFAEKRHAYIRQLLQQDALCSQLESGALADEQRDKLTQQWQVIQPVLNDGQAAMNKRFAGTGSPKSAPNDTVAQAQEMCLLLEFSGDLPSPAWAQSDREALRLTMLDAAMNGDKSFEQYQTEAGLYTLIQRWATLNKSALTLDNSGASLSDWQSRFRGNLTAVRQHHRLPAVDIDDIDLPVA